jgi:hypothetical protein
MVDARQNSDCDAMVRKPVPSPTATHWGPMVGTGDAETDFHSTKAVITLFAIVADYHCAP